mgnify:CR=1 FL=1
MRQTRVMDTWREGAVVRSNARGSVLAVCIFMLLMATACGIAGFNIISGPYSLTVINGVDGPMCSLRVKEASPHTYWGRNRLPSGQRLAPGDTFVIHGLAAGRYDVSAHLCDDDTHPGYGRSSVAVGPDAESLWIIGQ